MTVEKFLGYAKAKGVDIGEEVQKDLSKYQSELERKVKFMSEGQQEFNGPSVLSKCGNFLDKVPVKAVWIEADYGMVYGVCGEGSKEVLVFVLNGWVASYNAENQLLILIRAESVTNLR